MLNRKRKRDRRSVHVHGDRQPSSEEEELHQRGVGRVQVPHGVFPRRQRHRHLGLDRRFPKFGGKK